MDDRIQSDLGRALEMISGAVAPPAKAHAMKCQFCGCEQYEASAFTLEPSEWPPFVLALKVACSGCSTGAAHYRPNNPYAMLSERTMFYALAFDFAEMWERFCEVDTSFAYKVE
jgi:hypothetical protein